MSKSQGSDFMAVSGQITYSAGFHDGRMSMIDDYNQVIAPLQTREKIALLNWMTMLHRVHEAAQVGIGQKLKNRLEQLSPKLAETAAEYQNALIALKRAYGDYGASITIHHVRRVTSDYQERITAVLEGLDDGSLLRSIHEGDVRNIVFQPFEAPSSGRPKGMAKGRRLLAERLLKLPEAMSAAEKLASIRSELEAKGDALTDDDEMMLEALEKTHHRPGARGRGKASKFVNRLLSDYRMFSLNIYVEQSSHQNE